MRCAYPSWYVAGIVANTGFRTMPACAAVCTVAARSCPATSLRPVPSSANKFARAAELAHYT